VDHGEALDVVHRVEPRSSRGSINVCRSPSGSATVSSQRLDRTIEPSRSDSSGAGAGASLDRWSRSLCPGRAVRPR
jgi:hypothetical protein